VIASHEHRAIFVKTRKTAGTSIELALSAVCGERDIITPLDDTDEPLRTAAGTRGPQHYQRREAGLVARLRGTAAGAWNHMPASAVVRLVGQQTWDSYLTFAVERNPWDRAVSLYFFRGRKVEVMPPFGEFLRSMPADRLSNFDLYAIDGKIVVDRVLRYEQLDAELAAIWRQLDVAPPVLAKAKAGFRPAPSRDFREMYSEADAAFVAEVCSREINALGYAFDGASTGR
jgi:hypothetical protein